MNRRVIYIVILVFFLIFTLYEEIALRKYLFKQHYNVIAGSLPNFLGVVILSFAYISFKYPCAVQQIFKSISVITLGLVLYEFAQIFMPQRVFDFNDIAASIVGGLFCALLIFLVDKLTAQPKSFN